MEPSRRCVIVTPTFNSERFLDETIASVVLQAAPGVAIDYHVQDGGSTDRTEAIVRAWIARVAAGALPRLAGEVRLTWASARDRGMYDAINAGMAALAPDAADVVTWINSDDRLAPGAVATVDRIFADHPECEFVSGRTALLDEAGSIVSITYPQAYTRDALAAGRHDGRSHAFIMQEGTFFTGRLWSAVGGVDASFRLAGDWDLWRRMAAETAHYSIDTVTAFHRRRAGQLSSDMASYHAEVDARGPAAPSLAVAAAPPQLIRYDADAGTWIRTPFDALASRPPLAVIDGRRRRSCAVTFLAGFGAPEGPYPEYRLPAGVRWLRDVAAEIAVEAPYDALFRLTLTLRPTAPGLLLRVFANGVALVTLPLASPVPDTDQLVAAPVWLGVGRNVIEIEVVGEATGPRTLLLVACTAIVGADHRRDAPSETPAVSGELLRALKATAIVVTAADNPTRLAETLGSVREAAGAALFVRVVPATDAAGVVEALTPYAGRVGAEEDIAERLRRLGYRSFLEIAEGDCLVADALAEAHRALRDRGAAAVAGLVALVEGTDTTTRLLLPTAAGPMLRDLTGAGEGAAQVPLRLATRGGRDVASSEDDAPPLVWIVDDPEGWHPARPLFALAGALAMLGVDARYTLGATPPPGAIVIAMPGAWQAQVADYRAVVADGGVRLESARGGPAIVLPPAIDAAAFRPRARGAARAAFGLDADAFLALADVALVETVRSESPPDVRFVVLSDAPIEGVAVLSPPGDPDMLAHLLSAFDVVVAPRGSWLARAAPACAVATLDRDGVFVTRDAESPPGLAAALRRLARARAAVRLQGAEARAATVRTATVEALALALHRAGDSLALLAGWLAPRDHLAAGTIAVPTDAPFALESAIPQHRGFALAPFRAAVVEADPSWGHTLRLTAAEAVVLLRVEAITGSALRLHLTGPEASAWSVQIDDEPAAVLNLRGEEVTTARLVAPLPPGLHRVTLRPANAAALGGFGDTRIVAWEVVSTRETADPGAPPTRLVPAPLAGREVETLVADGDWQPLEGFLAPEAAHPAAGLHAPFRWTHGNRAAFRIRVARGGVRAIDLAVTGIAAGQRMRLVIGRFPTEWSAPLLAYVGRVSHVRWVFDWPAADVEVRIELDGRAETGNPRDLGVMVLGVALS